MCNPGPPTPQPTPTPIQPRQPDILRKSQLPAKKELLDPEDIAEVEYGKGTGTEKKDTRQAAQRTGTDALKINLNTGTSGETGGTGGLNV